MIKRRFRLQRTHLAYDHMTIDEVADDFLWIHEESLTDPGAGIIRDKCPTESEIGDDMHISYSKIYIYIYIYSKIKYTYIAASETIFLDMPVSGIGKCDIYPLCPGTPYFV